MWWCNRWQTLAQCLTCGACVCAGHRRKHDKMCSPEIVLNPMQIDWLVHVGDAEMPADFIAKWVSAKKLARSLNDVTNQANRPEHPKEKM